MSQIINLYLLELTDAAHELLPSYADYYEGFIVRETAARRARMTVHNGYTADETKHVSERVWLDPYYSKVTKIGEATPGCKTTLGLVMAKDCFH